ncbi:MAG: hypothetical protein IJF65_04785 [Clostridia bacterium]|nr:hypothetical protein [Clostridia bacterium]
MMENFWNQLSEYLPKSVDFLVYVAIAAVTLVGFFKCLLPLWRMSSLLRRGVRRLEKQPQGEHPVWQDIRFLGRPLESAWQRFLINAEQLDMRGLPCDPEDYINEETVVDGPGNAQLADLIPSLLTSLGILGTFIGLMNGLSGLDFANADNLINAIPTLLDGMRFAFATSVAGISCSILFNMLNRMAIGRCYKSLDDFSDAFAHLAMQRPLDHPVQIICQNQDRNVILRSSAEEMSVRMAGSIEMAIGRAMHPVTLSMDNFIMGATREQIDGVSRIVNQFVTRLNDSLNGQFLQLGETLTQINQTQALSADRLEASMQAAQAIVTDVTSLHTSTQSVMERFESYMTEMAEVRHRDEDFERRSAELLEQMHKASQAQSQYLETLKAQQVKLEEAMDQFTRIHAEQSDAITANSGEFRESSRLLADSYASFVENITEGLGRALGMFDENMHAMMDTLKGQLDHLNSAVDRMPDKLTHADDQYAQQVSTYISSLSRLQQAMTDIADALNKPAQEREA